VDERIVTVAVVTSRVEAELIVGMLENSGVPAMYSADDAGRQEPQLQLQGVRIMVAAPDEWVARRLLAEAETRPESEDE
jgi:hypothetical protein